MNVVMQGVDEDGEGKAGIPVLEKASRSWTTN